MGLDKQGTKMTAYRLSCWLSESQAYARDGIQ